MRNVRDQQEDAELKIASDIKNILNGNDVREEASEQHTGVISPPTEAQMPKRKANVSASKKRTAAGGSGGNSLPPKPKRGLAYILTTYIFIAIFLSLIGNLIYFNVKAKDEVLNSPYNKRQNSAAERVIRGDIVSEDGEVLATTRTNEDGSESRVYPHGDVYAHVVGFDSHGKSGLESTANYELLTSHANILDQIINGFREVKNPGDTLVTTLNNSLQETAYTALGDYQGAIVAMDPETGAIKAMVSKPDFDPNEIASAWDSIVSDSGNSQLVNRATQGMYAPGSTFKLITALSYFRKYGSFEQFRYDCTGSLPVGNTVVHCYNNAVHGEEDLISAFAHSCNTAFGTIGMNVGAQSLIDTADDMMFAKKLPSVVATSKSKWTLKKDAKDAEIVQTAFGQGQTLTNPYHMALIVSAIANNGVLMQPYLVEQIENTVGNVVSTQKPHHYKDLISLEEASALASLMRSVVTDGTGRALSEKSYTAYGKTGSADYVKTDGSLGTHSWFVGYAEQDGKKLVVTVVAENGGAGSTTAVPMAERLFDYYYRQ